MSPSGDTVTDGASGTDGTAVAPPSLPCDHITPRAVVSNNTAKSVWMSRRNQHAPDVLVLAPDTGINMVDMGMDDGDDDDEGVNNGGNGLHTLLCTPSSSARCVILVVIVVFVVDAKASR